MRLNMGGTRFYVNVDVNLFFIKGNMNVSNLSDMKLSATIVLEVISKSISRMITYKRFHIIFVGIDKIAINRQVSLTIPKGKSDMH